MFLSLQQRQYGLNVRPKLYDIARGVNFVQRLKLDKKLEVHTGCVNTICWSDTGQTILSGSDDQYLAITNPFSQKKLAYIPSGHRANIFSARFLPNCNDNHVISCSGDGKIYFTEVNREDTYGKNRFDCHVGTAYEVIAVPNEAATFLSCGEDGTVRWFDLRSKTCCLKENCKDDVMINCRQAVTSLAVDPQMPYHLAAACSDSSVRIFDRRMLGTRSSGNYTGHGITGMICRFTAPLEHKAYRITSLSYSNKSHEVLVSYSSENIYLFSSMDESKPKEFSFRNSAEKENPIQDGGSVDPSERQPPIKRLRLRGDWSDTGPNARPERERVQEERGGQNPHTTLMQRMSEMLTRWLDGNFRRDDASNTGGSSEQNVTAADNQNTTSPSQLVQNSNSQEQDMDSTEVSVNVDIASNILPTNNQVTSEESSSMSESNPLPTVSQSTDTNPIDETNTASLFSSLTTDDSINLPSCSKDSISAQGAKNNIVPATAESSKELKHDTSNVPNKSQEYPVGSGARPKGLSNSKFEPIINLQYSKQGTSASTISVKFASVNEHKQDVSDSGESQTTSDNSVVSHIQREGQLATTSENSEIASNDCQMDSENTNKDSEQSMSGDKECSTLKHNTVETGASSSSAQVKSDTPHSSIRGESEEERQLAAFRLQTAFRKRQEVKEQQEMKDVFQPKTKRKFVGHRNARTMIKEANFWGDNYVMSGSDCGHIFIWDKWTGEIIMLLEADRHVVNCLQPHPYDPILASSGIDYDIKLWSPLEDEPSFNFAKTAEVVRRNKIMLEETRDTITVPAAFMLRVLASLNQIRTGRRVNVQAEVNQDTSSDSDSS